MYCKHCKTKAKLIGSHRGSTWYKCEKCKKDFSVKVKKEK